MNELVKILIDNDGEKRTDPTWCLISPISGDPATLCGGEFFGAGQSDCIYKLKNVKRGGITCVRCRGIIREIKEVKL